MPVLQRLNRLFKTRIQKLEKAVAIADLTAAATSQAIDFASALPSDAFVVGAEIEILTAMSGGGAGNATADLGVKSGDTDGFIDGANIFTGAPSPISAPRGVLMPGQAASVTPVVTVISNVNVNTLTAGSIVARVYYMRTTEV